MELWESLISEGIINTLGWTLVHFVWQAAAVALVLSISLKLLNKFSANLRYVVSCTALIIAALSPVVTFSLIPGAENTIGLTEPAAIAQMPNNSKPVEMEIGIAAEKQLTDYTAVMEKSTENAPEVNAAVSQRVTFFERISIFLEPKLPYLVAGWLVGVFGLSLWYLGGWTQLQRMRRRMVKPVDERIRKKLKHVADAVGVSRAVEVMESALVVSPTVVGWIKPVILLPASVLTGFSSEQIEAILAHELAHIKRCDYLVNMLQACVEILGFYHPAVWWISKKIRAERENCCDDIAVKVTGDKIGYAKTLALFEGIRADKPELAVAASGSSLFQRICRLIQKEPEGVRIDWKPSIIAILLILALLIPTGFALTRGSVEEVEQLEAETGVSDGKVNATDISELSEPIGENWSRVLGEGPADIKLVGVVPFGGDYIYDAKGNRLGANPYFFDFDSFIIGNEVQPRTKIAFQVGAGYDLIVPFFNVPGQKHPYWGDRNTKAYKQGNKYIYPQEMHFSGLDESIDTVDSVLRYYGGKFNGAEVVFDGPFAVGKQVKKKLNGLDFKLQFKTDRRGSGGGYSGACFTLIYGQYPRISSNCDVIVYDTDGNRHIASGPTWKQVGDQISWEYSVPNLPGRYIKHITVGEDRYEKVFKGVVVRHKEAEAELEEMLNEMAQRLGLESKSEYAIYKYRYKNPEEAIKVIDIVKGTEGIREVYNALIPLCAKMEELEPEVRDKILKTVQKWSDSKILHTKKTGIQLGLRCGQIKSAEQMLHIMEMAAEGHVQARMYKWSNQVHFFSCVEKFEPEHIDRFKKLALTSQNYKIVRSCLGALSGHSRKVGINDTTASALWEIAADNRPWIWWPAVNSIWPVDLKELPEDLKLKFAAVWLARQSRGTNFPKDHSKLIARLKPGIFKLYSEILTPEICYAGLMGGEVVNSIHKQMPPDDATAVFVRFMRQLSKAENMQLMAGDYKAMSSVYIQTLLMIDKINQWHNINIGGLSKEGNEEPTRFRSIAIILKLADETIKWHDELYNADFH